MKSLHDIAHSLLRGALGITARMPLGALYVFSDLAAPVVRHVARYRLRVVRDNLAKCFPDMAEKDRRAIEKDFYRNFTDYVVETVKLLHITDEEMERRMTFEGLEHIDRALDSGRDVLIYFSHCFNWEWAPSVTLRLPSRAAGRSVVCAQVYRPLRDRDFDSLMLRIRSRFGSESFAKSQVLRDLIRLRREGTASVTGFMSDQKPSHGDPVHIIPFLGRPTKVITGTETLARRLGMAVVYWDITKPARGHYHVNVVRLTENAADTQPFELTDKYFSLLEKNIRQNPSIWLWTHNRWKHRLTADEIAEYDKTRQNNL